MGVQTNESYVGHVETLLAGLAKASNPASFLVDNFPIMKLIPEWLPGAGWKRKAAVWRHINSIVANCLWDTVKERVVRPFFSLGIITIMSYAGGGNSGALCRYGIVGEHA
jgi:hypothetical protein